MQLTHGIINIKAESFPWQVKLIGIIMVLIALGSVFAYWWMIVIGILGMMALTGYSGTLIDPTGKTYKEYTSYLFIKTGATVSFNFIEKVYVNDTLVSQKLYGGRTLNSMTRRSVEYNVYMKTDSGDKIFLTGGEDKAAMMQLAQSLAVSLEAPFGDNTTK